MLLEFGETAIFSVFCGHANLTMVHLPNLSSIPSGTDCQRLGFMMRDSFSLGIVFYQSRSHDIFALTPNNKLKNVWECYL